MIIHSMTATFGKLERKTIQLTPGLNVIYAPNEWGKSTWCAFLLAMFYGVDTRSRSTKQVLSDKEHFQPWSGSPMEGRMELSWQGREITIERSTRGRIPLGEFRAYETQTGKPIPEIRGDNCGEVILGVEPSVYRRAGFIRMSEMNITEDDALRKRLNDLVTMGDDSGDEAVIENGIRTLRRQIRSHKTGLLPQVEAAIQELNSQKENVDNLTEAIAELKKQSEELHNYAAQLENHQIHLENETAENDRKNLLRAISQRNQSQKRINDLNERLSSQISRKAAEEKIQLLNRIESEISGIQNAFPEEPLRNHNLERMQINRLMDEAEKDSVKYRSLMAWPWIILSIVGAVSATIGSIILWKYWVNLLTMGLVFTGVLSFAIGISEAFINSSKRRRLAMKHGSESPAVWKRNAEKRRKEYEQYLHDIELYNDACADIQKKLKTLEKQKAELTADYTKETLFEIISLWDEYNAESELLQRSSEYVETIQKMMHPFRKEFTEDTLNLNAQETAEEQENVRQDILISERKIQRRELQLSDYDSPERLKINLDELQSKKERLTNILCACELAASVHKQTVQELHHRFSPGITSKAQDYLSRMTGNNYDKIILNQDFSIKTGHHEDIQLRSQLFRSAGTIDQINLSLRLAVAQELTPSAPLVFDDAFVRFDDERLKATMEILKELSRDRQILLFTCQNREMAMV